MNNHKNHHGHGHGPGMMILCILMFGGLMAFNHFYPGENRRWFIGLFLIGHVLMMVVMMKGHDKQAPTERDDEEEIRMEN